MKILLVEDETLLRLSCAHLLSALGHDVTEAANGHEATLAWEEHGGFDKVVTDVRMPGTDGIYLLNYLSGLMQPPPCYVHSGDEFYDIEAGRIALRELEEIFEFAKFHDKLDFSRSIYEFLETPIAA